MLRQTYPYGRLFLAAVGFGWALAAASSASAQAVQQPVIDVIGVDTTVSVPDGGSATLGGIKKASSGRTVRFGVPTWNMDSKSNQTFGIRATIIDHQELDAKVRAEGAALLSRRMGVQPPIDPKATAIQQKADHLTRNLADSPRPVAATRAEMPTLNVAEIRQRNESAAAERAEETKALFAKAQTAEAENKPGIAKIYYQMVTRRDQGALKELSLARIAALRSPPASPGLANK